MSIFGNIANGQTNQEKLNELLKEKRRLYKRTCPSVSDDDITKMVLKDPEVKNLAIKIAKANKRGELASAEIDKISDEMVAAGQGEVWDYDPKKDTPKTTRIFNAEIHWAQPIRLYIERPGVDNNFIADIYTDKQATYVDSFDDDAVAETLGSERWSQTVEPIVLCQGSQKNPQSLVQCFDEVISVEEWLSLDENKKKEFLSRIYNKAWLEISMNIQEMIERLGINPNLYLDKIGERFSSNEFSSTIELHEILIKSSIYGGSQVLPTCRKVVYDPILDKFAGDITE